MPFPITLNIVSIFLCRISGNHGYFYCITAIHSFAFWLLFVFTVQSQKDSGESGHFLSVCVKWQDKEMLLKWPGLLHVWLLMRADSFFRQKVW